MKRFILPLICLLIVCASCSKKKNEVVPVGTLSADIGGTTMTFNAGGNYPTQSTLNIEAVTSSGSTAFNITIHPTSGVPGTGTYTNTGLGSNLSIVTMDYIYPRLSGTGNKLFVSDPNNIQPCTVTITSITNTNVQGTFTTTLLDTDTGGTNLSVVNGKFNANIQ